MRKPRGLWQNHSEEGETTSLVAKMKLSQSSAELALVSLKRDWGGAGHGFYLRLCLFNTLQGLTALCHGPGSHRVGSEVILGVTELRGISWKCRSQFPFGCK